jgi:hypothetical protein
MTPFGGALILKGFQRELRGPDFTVVNELKE